MTRSLVLAGMFVAITALHGQASPAIMSDPPADSAPPATLVEIAVPSHGAQLLGAFYLASGSQPHPTVIIYHGFPGYEQNLDVAQTLRRAGYNVLAVHYRGSWGISGTFSYQHVIEDADAQVQWITSPEVVAKYRVDPKHIVVIGHSLGGYASLSAAAHNPGVVAAVSLSGASLGTRFGGLKTEDREQAVVKGSARIDPADLLPLTGTSATTLVGEVFDHRNDWTFLKLAPSLGKRPILLVTASDGTGPNSTALLQTLKAQGNTSSAQIEMKTDHSFSDHRIALQQAILDFLNQQAR